MLKLRLLSGSTMPCLHVPDLEYTDPDFFLGVLDTQDCWNPPVYTPELCCDLTQGVRFFFWAICELKQRGGGAETSSFMDHVTMSSCEAFRVESIAGMDMA